MMAVALPHRYPESSAMLASGSITWLDILLWIGFTVVTIAMLVLMRTRWGNAKTVTKCIWLSIFVHLLLGGLAYGTKFLWQTGSGGDVTTVAVQLVLDSIEEESDNVEPAEETPTETIEIAAEETQVNEQPEQIVAQPLEIEAPPELLDDAVTLESPPELNLPEDESALADNEATAPTDGSQVVESTDSSVPLEAPPMLELPTLIAQSAAPVESAEALPDESTTTTDPLIQPPIDVAANQADSKPAEVMEPSTTLSNIDSERESSALDAARGAFSPEVVFAQPAVRSEPVAAIYSLRAADKRAAALLAHGGNDQTEQAVEAALQWLAATQQPDGRWDPLSTEAGKETRVLGHDRQGAGGDADNALTGLALLAFLGAGHTHLSGDYTDVVDRALQFLLESQHSSGHMAGRAGLFAHMYSHSIATLAVSECLALTGDQRLKPCVERAIGYSIDSQDPQSGSWRYLPRESGDMSQFGWQVMAIKSASLSGVEVPKQTTERMHHFLRTATSGHHGGLAAYRPGHPPSPTMTAEALVCRYFLGEPVNRNSRDEAVAHFTRVAPGKGEVDYYLWYYATLALFQSGSTEWDQWNQSLQSTLLQAQVRQGTHAGSWPPNGRWCGYGGRVYSTAMGAMCLEVYYRYLPIVQMRSARR